MAYIHVILNYCFNHYSAADDKQQATIAEYFGYFTMKTYNSNEMSSDNFLRNEKI